MIRYWPALVSVLFGLAKLWDGVSGPLIGSWSDRTRSRYGRRRPFLLAALPFLAFGFVMLWWVPTSLSGAALVAWIAFALFVFFGAFDLYTLPHMALGAELLDSSLEVGSWDEVENLAEQGAESLHVESPLWQAAEVWLPPSLLGEAQRLPALDQHANLDKSVPVLRFRFTANRNRNTGTSFRKP